MPHAYGTARRTVLRYDFTLFRRAVLRAAYSGRPGGPSYDLHFARFRLAKGGVAIPPKFM